MFLKLPVCQVNDSIDDYWKDTQESLTETGEKLKEDYDNSIKELEKKLVQSPQYFLQIAEKVRQLNAEVNKWLNE